MNEKTMMARDLLKQAIVRTYRQADPHDADAVDSARFDMLRCNANDGQRRKRLIANLLGLRSGNAAWWGRTASPLFSAPAQRE